jgi:5-methyltetrahydrofolate--homocysteine methyltransferase
METILRSTKKAVSIGRDRPVIIIGEKLNPTGRKKMMEALQTKNHEYLRELAQAQVKAGADVLDVNVGVPGLDDVQLMSIIVRLMAETVDVPLCLDSPNSKALAAGLKVAPGKPLVNSTTGKEGVMAAVLPLVKEFGAAVIGLIWMTAESRLRLRRVWLSPKKLSTVLYRSASRRRM